MRRIRDVLRLKYAQGMSERAIAASLGLGKGTLGAYLGRARAAGLTWPLPVAMSDDDLELLLFPRSRLICLMLLPWTKWSRRTFAVVSNEIIPSLASFSRIGERSCCTTAGRGQFWTPITPRMGSFLQADLHQSL